MSPLDVSKYLDVRAYVSDSREQYCGVIIYRSIIFLFVALNLLSLGQLGAGTPYHAIKLTRW